jgi:hypothetical protein
VAQALYQSGSAICYVYFPTTALVSMVYEFEDGASAETARRNRLPTCWAYGAKA